MNEYKVAVTSSKLKTEFTIEAYGMNVIEGFKDAQDKVIWLVPDAEFELVSSKKATNEMLDLFD